MKTFYRLKKSVGISVLKKHNFMCSECGATSNLCVHHIQRMNPDDVEYNNESNLTVLCRSCHMSYHRKAGHIVSEGKGYPNPWGRRGKGKPEVFCHCGAKQHAKGFCRKHYRLEFKDKWYGKIRAG
jgi:hypothetical protein